MENYRLKLKNREFILAFVTTFFVFAFYILTFPSEASAALIIKPPTNLGLVGYWPMNENTGTVASDFSGNGNRGILTSGPTWVDGKRGKALNFDGVDDYVDVGAMSSVEGIGAMSAGVWVKITAYETSGGSWPGIAGMRFRGLDGPFELALVTDDGGADSNKFEFLVRNSANTTVAVRSNSVPSLNTWYHLFGTY